VTHRPAGGPVPLRGRTFRAGRWRLGGHGHPGRRPWPTWPECIRRRGPL